MKTSAILISIVRYRKGENVICFNGEDETLAHMEKLGSFGEKYPYIYNITIMMLIYFAPDNTFLSTATMTMGC